MLMHVACVVKLSDAHCSWCLVAVAAHLKISEALGYIGGSQCAAMRTTLVYILRFMFVFRRCTSTICVSGMWLVGEA